MVTRQQVSWSGLVLLVLSAAVRVQATDVQPAVGHRAPDFVLRDLQGRSVQLSRVLQEKAVLLNFWATWCPPCRAEMPLMEEAYRAFKGRGLEILAVSVDTGREEAVAPKVKAFMEELRLTYPALLGLGGETVRAYRLRGLPTTFLIDRTGIVRAMEIGFRNWASLVARKRIEELLQ